MVNNNLGPKSIKSSTPSIAGKPLVKAIESDKLDFTVVPSQELRKVKPFATNHVSSVTEIENAISHLVNVARIPAGRRPHFRNSITDLIAATLQLPSEQECDTPTPLRPSTARSSFFAQSADTSMPAEAIALFGNLPDGLDAKAYERSTFPQEWFENASIIRHARRIVYAYKNRQPGTELQPTDMARVRAANRFMRAYERQRQRTKASTKLGAQTLT